MKFQLPDLPYTKNALEPFMSAETFEFHHGKHHQAYVDKLNSLIDGTEMSRLSLEEIIAKSNGPLFNNAAQTWNHSFFWNSLSPEKKKPGTQIQEALEKNFGSVDAFTDQFTQASMNVFGSGWAWLTQNNSDGKLAIETTANAQTPLRTGTTPLLTCDLWEHAYYIDFRNARAKYLSSFFNIVNWEFAEKNMTQPWKWSEKR